MKKETLQTRFLRSCKDVMEVSGGHWISAVRHPPRIYPRDNLLRLADRRKGALGFSFHNLVEEGLGKS
jgi:hypothetical protein